MSFVAPVLGLVGTAVSFMGQIAAGRAQQQAAQYQAQVAANNAIIARQNAEYAIQAGQEKAAETSLRAAEAGGEIKAAQAANNVDVNTGSNKAVQISQRELGRLDTKTAMNNAQMAAYGYRSQATGFQAESGLKSYEASTAMPAATLGAIGTAFGSAAKWISPSTFTTS